MGKYLYTTCHEQFDKLRKVTTSSFLVEIGIWIFATISAFLGFYFLCIVALVFTIFRFLSSKKCCPSCKGVDIIPSNSVRGKQITGGIEVTNEE